MTESDQPELSDLSVEQEAEEEAYVEYDIATYPSDYTLEVIQTLFASGGLIIPPYQRKYVWKIEQASLLVESFLMGLPVPPIFLYVNEENIMEVIDGQQRLRSMLYFMEGYFGEPDTKGRRKLFKLSGLSEKSPYNDRQFGELEEKSQRKIRSSVLRAINVKQLSPSKASTSVFHIFERLNTGGTSLMPQEIRNAVFRGEIVNRLNSLNVDSNWRTIMGSPRPDKHQRDIELILRSFSLFESWPAYEKPMKEYLNSAMKLNRDAVAERWLEFERRFPVVCAAVVSALGTRPFRPRGPLNSAFLESFVVAMLEIGVTDSEVIRAASACALKSSDFMRRISHSTTDTQVLRERIKDARSFLSAE